MRYKGCTSRFQAVDIEETVIRADSALYQCACRIVHNNI
jgi:hypothetical protein